MKFYVAELTNVHARAQAERIEAKSLTSAMRVAARNQCFHGTALKVGNEVDNHGFIKKPLAVKVDGQWYRFQHDSDEEY